MESSLGEVAQAKPYLSGAETELEIGGTHACTLLAYQIIEQVEVEGSLRVGLQVSTGVPRLTELRIQPLICPLLGNELSSGGFDTSLKSAATTHASSKARVLWSADRGP